MAPVLSRRFLLALVAASSLSCGKSGVFFQSINPGSGRMSGGEEVRIRGSGFRSLGNLEIRVGGKPATNVGVADDETIVLTTPEGRAPDQGRAIDVFLLTSEGRSYVLRGAFTYRAGPSENTGPNSDLQRRL